MPVKTGCCGYRFYRPPEGVRKRYRDRLQAYVSQYELVELNSTFYELPRPSTARRWRELADEVKKEFEFIVKCNQRVTHPATSPTYRKVRAKIPPEKADEYGFFRQTEGVYEAWEETKRICLELRARICLFQCPTSFRPTEENLRNMETFFSSVERSGMTFAFEPRGAEWGPELVRDVCRRLELTHVVDPFKARPSHIHDVVYFRLHGLGRRPYAYKFRDEELLKLRELCREYETDWDVYVLWNNYEMYDDCRRFSMLVRGEGLPKTPWGAEAVVESLDLEYPTTRDEIIERFGRVWCWVEPDRRVRVGDVVGRLSQDTFRSREELLKALEEVIPRSGET